MLENFLSAADSSRLGAWNITFESRPDTSSDTKVAQGRSLVPHFTGHRRSNTIKHHSHCWIVGSLANARLSCTRGGRKLATINNRDTHCIFAAGVDQRMIWVLPWLDDNA